MPSTYQLYYGFRRSLARAGNNHNALLDAFSQLFQNSNIEAAALFSFCPAPHLRKRQIAALGPQNLWRRYLCLCEAEREPLSRIVRLSPHPVSLSDLKHRSRLHERSGELVKLLREFNLDDAFIIPVLDHKSSLTLMVTVGSKLDLPPTKRHLLAQAAGDVTAQLCPSSEGTAHPPPLHQQLTARQMEIAGWLVAGKTDWEIGEILSISPKTVNFHVEKMKRTYGVKSRNQFVAHIVHDGGLAPGDRATL